MTVIVEVVDPFATIDVGLATMLELPGSVAEKTVRLASSSVLVARGEPADAEGG